jgi:hypothetical protein
MGCFNATGFFSKLPLQARDKMVLIFCADMSKITNDGLPIYPAEKYVPLNAPIFCEYNDYGATFEDSVEKDANAEFFEKSIGVTCEEFCDMLHDYGNVTIEELESKEEKEDLEENDESDFFKQRREKKEKFLKILHKLFDNAYHRWRNKMGVVWIMEHRDVYEKISKLCKNSVTSWVDDENIVEKRCETAFKMVEDYPEVDGIFNLLHSNRAYRKIEFDLYYEKIGNRKLTSEDIAKKRDELEDKYGGKHYTFASSGCFTEHSLGEAFPTYESITGATEWKKYKDNFVDFFKFTRVMYALHRIFEPSTYASQEVCTKITKATYDILKEKSDAICKKYEEMRS